MGGRISEPNVASASAGVDRWAWWPTFCTVAVAALFVFVGGLPGPLNFLLISLAIVTCPVLALLLIGSACVLGWHRRPRGATSALLALAVPALLLGPMVRVEPYVHLALTLGLGVGYLGHAPPEGQAVAIYDWSTGLVGGPNTFLIRDPTDAIASPHTKDGSPAWKNDDLLRECASRSEHLIGHYYICID